MAVGLPVYAAMDKGKLRSLVKTVYADYNMFFRHLNQHIVGANLQHDILFVLLNAAYIVHIMSGIALASFTP